MSLKSLVPLRAQGSRPPLFLIHGVDGGVEHFRVLANLLDRDQPVYGIRTQALSEKGPAVTRMEHMGAYHIAEVKTLQPHGPYHFIGFSFGSLLAFEMARQLHTAGEKIGLVGLLDSRPMKPLLASSDAASVTQVQSWAAGHLARLLRGGGLRYAAQKLGARGLRILYTMLDSANMRIPVFCQRPDDINWFAGVKYKPQPSALKITLFRAVESHSDAGPDARWARLAQGGVEVHDIPYAHHENLLSEPQVSLLAAHISDCLQRP